MEHEDYAERKNEKGNYQKGFRHTYCPKELSQKSIKKYVSIGVKLVCCLIFREAPLRILAQFEVKNDSFTLVGVEEKEEFR